MPAALPVIIAMALIMAPKGIVIMLSVTVALRNNFFVPEKLLSDLRRMRKHG
jgi:hypothetical protein